MEMYIRKYTIYLHCDQSVNKVLHAVTFMVPASIIFQFLQHFDAAVCMLWWTQRMLNVMSCPKLDLANWCRSDIRFDTLPLLKTSTLWDKQVYDCCGSAVLSHHSALDVLCCDQRFIKRPALV